jgi:hypothetical protein
VGNGKTAVLQLRRKDGGQAMKRIETQKRYTQIVLLPTFGFVRRDCGVYDYKYRIAFAWLFWRLSIGLW